MKAAKALGFKVLKDVPRIGAFHFKDPTGEYYLKPGEGAELEAWVKKAIEVAQAIEAQGIGFAQVKSLGEDMAASDPGSAWFRLLDQATDVHQERAVERAFSEWADGDSLAVHVAYGLDVFCSDDVGKSNVADSVISSLSAPSQRYLAPRVEPSLQTARRFRSICSALRSSSSRRQPGYFAASAAGNRGFGAVWASILPVVGSSKTGDAAEGYALAGGARERVELPFAALEADSRQGADGVPVPQFHRPCRDH